MAVEPAERNRETWLRQREQRQPVQARAPTPRPLDPATRRFAGVVCDSTAAEIRRRFESFPAHRGSTGARSPPGAIMGSMSAKEGMTRARASAPVLLALLTVGAATLPGLAQAGVRADLDMRFTNSAPGVST